MRSNNGYRVLGASRITDSIHEAAASKSLTLYPLRDGACVRAEALTGRLLLRKNERQADGRAPEVEIARGNIDGEAASPRGILVLEGSDVSEVAADPDPAKQREGSGASIPSEFVRGALERAGIRRDTHLHEAEPSGDVRTESASRAQWRADNHVSHKGHHSTVSVGLERFNG